MYWPVGVPQLYAHHVSTTRTCDYDQSAPPTNGTSKHDQQMPRDGTSPVGSENKRSSDGIIDLKVTRAEHLLLTLSQRTLNVWSTRPMVLLTQTERVQKSVDAYGDNVALHIKPDGTMAVVCTALSYLIMYSIEIEPNTRVYRQISTHSQSRRQSLARKFGDNDSDGVTEVFIKFQKTIKIDAGISTLLSFDQELVVATIEPAAIQCLRWDTQRSSSHTTTQLLSKMIWMEPKDCVSHMVQDRAMNLLIWLNTEGVAYAVRRSRPSLAHRASSEDSSQSNTSSMSSGQRVFEGYQFYQPQSPQHRAVLAAINARFSLIALALANGEIWCYTAKDYSGNIPYSHNFKLAGTGTKKAVKALTWSPDGFCLFAGFADGWCTWSVFGREGASSYTSSSDQAKSCNDEWLLGTQTATFISTGAELLLTTPSDHSIWKLNFSKSAATGCFSCANLVRALHQTPTEVTIYRGHELSDLTSISKESSLWHHAQYPAAYLHNQWPMRLAVVSQDGRYVAIAGKRGLAHYSVSSGRWRTFASAAEENSFTVRGGFCWFNHVLAVAVEHAQGYELRLYSRDQELGPSPSRTEPFAMPIVFVGPSGEDSLLVYTYENVLYHFVLNTTEAGAQLLQVGQIAFHGVIRAPSRVRSVSWILPEHQLRNGDPSRDVEHAAVLFLIDDKLVLLQPTKTPVNSIKYEMRVIAHQVEYYILMRDQLYFNFEDTLAESMPPTPSAGAGDQRSNVHYSLRDSLWYFTGTHLHLWANVNDVLQESWETSALPRAPFTVPVDFYPTSILLNKGIVLGTEAELLQRRDLNFAQYRNLIRSQLFLPYVLQHYLLEARDTSAAFAIANQYQDLSYFAHALEVLLHNVLEAEDDRPRDGGTDTIEPLPAVLSFLQMVLPPGVYLSTIIQCIRKTEFSFWKYVFKHLPSPEILFEQALDLNDLKTASGYLIVLQTLEEEGDDTTPSPGSEQRLQEQVVRLMRLAKAKNDFELCSELARFMIAVDPRGDALRQVVKQAGFSNGKSSQAQGNMYLQPQTARLSRTNIALQDQAGQSKHRLEKLDVRLTRVLAEEPRSAGAESEGAVSKSSIGDYFSASPGGY